MHYNRWRRTGDPLTSLTDLKPKTPAERLAAGLERKPNGCLEWTGATQGSGYGVIWLDGKNIGTHRLAWMLVNGPIPDGLMIRHFVCDNPPCCDPDHLRPGTNTDNMADMVAKGRHSHGDREPKTHCVNGHPFDETNTQVDLRGWRSCRTCMSVRSKAKYDPEKRHQQYLDKKAAETEAAP